MLKRLSSLILLILLTKGFLFAQEENPFELYKTKWLGKPAPNFHFVDISGREFNISDLKGKVVLINTWFIGCSGCKIEYPGLQTLKQRFNQPNKMDKVVFLSLALDSKESLVEFLKKNPLNFYNMADAESISKGEFKVLGFPTNFILDKNGIVRHIKIGGSTQSADDIEYEMLQLLK